PSSALAVTPSPQWQTVAFQRKAGGVGGSPERRQRHVVADPWNHPARDLNRWRRDRSPDHLRARLGGAVDGVHRLAWAKHDLRPPAEPTMRSFPEARRRRIVRRLSSHGSKG